MANDTNIVVLVGRLTREAEIKYLNSGTAMCRFSIAVNRKKRSGDSWEDEASFFDIVLWGKQAEAISKYLEKGKQISVSGELRQSRWEQDGQTRSRVEIHANNVQLLGGSSQGMGQSQFGSGRSDQSFGNVQPQGQQNKNSGNDFSYSGPEQFDDDIPF